ncbi:MAG: bifunctional anthranilate synthase component II/anthranilate phosphoribosyltransferase [Oscillospiraceae bacterium]
MILLIDNYDSFTYNLYQQIGSIYPDIKVVRNDMITLDEIEKLSPEALVISPGPGYPSEAGISVDAIKRFAGKLPILGVCLGHQSIAEAFGGKIVRALEPKHGKASMIKVNNGTPLFKGMPEKIKAARYHSLIVEKETLPDCLEIIAEDEDGQIMALRHKELAVYGVQFHPESVLTDLGKSLISNFLSDIAEISGFEKVTVALPDSEKKGLMKYIKRVSEGFDLTQPEAEDAMDIIMSGGATDAQIAGFLTFLRTKGETVEEITGFARIMRKKASIVPTSKAAVDIVGTGGDLAGSFNISTTSSFVIAGTGLNVAKHGNRSVSSKSGAADVLESLGVKISLSPAQASACIQNVGISFLFAQSFHSSMRFVGKARREMGVRTVFNILGPLANPALSDYILLGVYDDSLLEKMAVVLMNLGVKSAMIVYGDGLDEVSVSGETKVCELRGKKIIKYSITPEEFGLKRYPKEDIIGGTPAENAQITLDILSGKEHGAKRDIVLLNSACAIYCTGAASSIEEGLEMARESIDSGKALAKLEKLKEFSNKE